MTADNERRATTPQILMMLGRIAQGLEGAKSHSLRVGWCDWAIEVVESTGGMIDFYAKQHEAFGRLTAVSRQTHFVFAIAAACAAQEIGDLTHDVGQVMDSANGEMNERLRLEDKVEGLETELFEAVRVAYRRGAQDWVRMNYPAWLPRLAAGHPNEGPAQ